MPNYDLRCTSCSNEFTARASMTERTNKHILCPACGSAELEAVFKAMNFQVSKESPVCPNSQFCGSGCQHAHA